MNKTLYIRDEDAIVWERARELAGEKLSPVIVAALKRFIAQKEGEEALTKGFERIELSFRDADKHEIPVKKAFMGKWIIPPKEPYREYDLNNEDYSHNYALALTPKGNVVIYSWVQDTDFIGQYRFRVYPSLEAAAAEREVNGVATYAIENIGVPVEELDI